MWIFAWPVIVICTLVAGWVAWTQARHPDVEAAAWPERASAGWSRWVTALIWGLAVVVPVGLFAGYLHSWGSVTRFLEESTQALVQSGVVAGSVGLGTMVFVVLAWCAFSAQRVSKAGPVLALGLFLFGMIVPGILMGSAILRLVTDVATTIPVAGELQDGLGALVWGHLARFGALGVLVGGLIAWNEARDAREMRGLDGCGCWRGVWEFVIRSSGGVVLAVGIASGLMSLYEIEATILLIPPGPGSLSHTILAYLHFAKNEQLCAAGVSVFGSGLVLAVAAAVLARASLSRHE